ncbi:uncharacterized protein si:dkey-22n8.3 [Myxocyprinus asiaticus]|uniref:uncharacterized protein si:dkey-22n8.3 n=1 Tax=Myxocyprinus asiaticus TaxID=70543 RepID=UPI002223C5DD|nr:uncharacterized protein si:dkey-22n8.3 [Myxocyprinus asiaticus]XP_051560749.1 uncharacterized protein si:dkey-22n8.3 [Myxocyprinus asiaticus]XP_051560750.1 uncharacterized protein si:dkey-22n8.3 [Myxocyprinus asiaticus]
MFAVMSVERAGRLRGLKFLQLEGSWIQRKIPPLVAFSTKANNINKPVRYTSIKKAKPKTILDIAKLLQLKTALKAAASTTKPSTPNQYDAMVDVAATFIPTAKVKTVTRIPPAKDAVQGLSIAASLVDEGPSQDIADLGGVARPSIKDSSRTEASTAPEDTHVPQVTVENRTVFETTPASTAAPEMTPVASALDVTYSKDVTQNPKKMSDKILDVKDAGPKVVAAHSGVEAPPVSALASQEAWSQGDTTSEVSPVSELSSTDATEDISSYGEVAFESKDAFVSKFKQDVVASDKTIYTPDSMASSKGMATPEVFAGPETELKTESFNVSEVAEATNESSDLNVASAQDPSKLQARQSLESLAVSWSPEYAMLYSTVHADKPYSDTETGSFPDVAVDSDSIIDISTGEAVAVSSGKVATLPKVCLEEAFAVTDPNPEDILPEPTEERPIFKTIIVSVNEADKVVGVTERIGDAPALDNLTDPILMQTEDLEKELQTNSVDASESFPDGTGDSYSILDITTSEVAVVISHEDPTLPEVCIEEAIAVADPIPEISSSEPTEEPPIVETIMVSVSEDDKVVGVTEMTGDALASSNLTDPVQMQTKLLEKEVPTDPVDAPVSFPDGTADSATILYITTCEATRVISDEVPNRPEVCPEEAIVVADPIPDDFSPEPIEEPPIFETISASVSKAEKIVDLTETFGDPPVSSNLTDLVQFQTEVLEKKILTDLVNATVSFPNGTADSDFILNIVPPEATVVISKVPTFPEVSPEEVVATCYATRVKAAVSDLMPEAYSSGPTEEPSVVETLSASLGEADKAVGMAEITVDAPSSNSLKDPVLVQTEVLEEGVQADVESPEVQLDPIQRLFLDKIREFSIKSQASGGLLDAGPEYEKAFSEELAKLQRFYGGGDLTAFPEFKFCEPQLDEGSSK